MRNLTELQSADAYCRYLTRRHYENFSVVSLFLPVPIRTHLARIYAFCRTTDDYGDESKSNSVALKRLESWRAEVHDCFVAESKPIHPVLISLHETLRTCPLDENLFQDLIQANIEDQTTSTYDAWSELHRYCMLSAAPVGKMVLRVFGIEDPRADCLSDDVCIGLQLANHAQDVRRDALRGRCYLLREVIAKDGVAGAVRDFCDRAGRLLQSGRALEAMVPATLRVQLTLYRLGGMEVVRSIRRLDYRTDQVRPATSTATKVKLVPRAVLESIVPMSRAEPQRSAQHID